MRLGGRKGKKKNKDSKIFAKTFYGDFFIGDLIKIADTIFNGKDSLQELDSKIKLQPRDLNKNTDKSNSNSKSHENNRKEDINKFDDTYETGSSLTEEERRKIEFQRRHNMEKVMEDIIEYMEETDEEEKSNENIVEESYEYADEEDNDEIDNIFAAFGDDL